MEPLSFKGVRRYSLKDRKSKVERSDFAKPFVRGESAKSFLNGLPNILAAGDLRKIAKAMAGAKKKKLPLVWAIGAHVIKVGLNPVIVDLMREGFVTALAMNGACIIHDVELALVGRTSEDVPAALGDRSFGMAEETSAFINEATGRAYREQKGLGETLGRHIVDSKLPFAGDSLLAEAFQLGIPATVHVAIGGDIVHMHPEVSGEAVGAASFLDFRIFCAVISKVVSESVILNVGSAVILPVVIEKAIAVCRNLGYPVEGFTGVNFDFIRHYRSHLNPVMRAKDLKGEGFEIIGHHEILLPLLSAALKEWS